MKLFKTKAEKEKEAKTAVSSALGKSPEIVAAPGVSGEGSYAHILRKPRITEKATDLQSHGAYVFDVLPAANKREIAAAIKSIYKVTPRAIRIVSVPAKRRRSMRTGKTGIKSGGKKAYVYLKQGDSITLA